MGAVVSSMHASESNRATDENEFYALAATALVVAASVATLATGFMWKKKGDHTDIVEKILAKTAPVAAAEELSSLNEEMTCERKLNGVKLIISKDPVVANYVFNGPSNSNYVRRPASDQGLKKLGMFNRGLIWNNDITTWKKIRGLFQRALSHDNIEKAASTIRKEARALLENELKEENPSINMMSVCRRLTFRATLNTFFGIDSSDFAALGIDEAQFIDAIVSYFKAWEFFLLRPEKYWDDKLACIHSSSVQKLQTHVKDMLGSINSFSSITLHSNLFIKQLVTACQDSDSSNHDDLLMQSALEMMLAGTDTSSVTAYYALLGIAKDKRLQQELRSDLHASPDLSKSKLLQSIVNETLRFKPVGPVVLREAVQDDPKFPGVECIQGGTAILIHLAEMNLCESNWSNPTEFCPRRFMDMQGKVDNFFPFGNGPKGCIGMHLGRREVNAIVEAVILNFDMSIDAEDSLESLETHWDIANQPDNPVSIKLHHI